MTSFDALFNNYDCLVLNRNFHRDLWNNFLFNCTKVFSFFLSIASQKNFHREILFDNATASIEAQTAVTRFNVTFIHSNFLTIQKNLVSFAAAMTKYARSRV